MKPYLDLGYAWSDYLETGRNDETWSVSVGSKYFATHNSYVVAGISHMTRRSNDVASPVSNDFDKNLLFLNFSALLYPL